MSTEYPTIHQHEPLRVPANWTTDEKRLIVQLEELFDDLYRILNRIKISDLSPTLRKTITDAEGNISELEQTASGLASRVSTAEGDISTIEQTASGLASRVSTAEGNISTVTQTANDVSATVSGQKVGGANILRSTYLFGPDYWTYSIPSGSSFGFGLDGKSETTMKINSIFLGSGYAYVSQDVTGEPSTKYVLSVNCLITNSPNTSQAFVRAIEYDSAYNALASHYIPITSLAPDADKFIAFTSHADCAVVQVQAVVWSGLYLYWEKVKLEKGTIPTDWTPETREFENTSLLLNAAGFFVKTTGVAQIDTAKDEDFTSNGFAVLTRKALRVVSALAGISDMVNGTMAAIPVSSTTKSGTWIHAALSSRPWTNPYNIELTGSALGAGGGGTYRYTISIPIYHSSSNSNSYNVTVYLAATSGGTTINAGALPFTASGYYTTVIESATWLGNAASIWCKIVLGSSDFLSVNSGKAFSVTAEELAGGFTAGWQEMKLYRYEAETPT